MVPTPRPSPGLYLPGAPASEAEVATVFQLQSVAHVTDLLCDLLGVASSKHVSLYWLMRTMEDKDHL